MLLKKLAKSYSNSLPIYEPIPSDHPTHDHETGSFSCTYSPQHSVGVARITVQSAELHEPRGWKRWFKLKPSTWVKVKVLGKTKGGVGGKGMGEIKTWREDRVVGSTRVQPRTFTPNFEFKSYYALIGPYEKQLELEVRNKRSWLWPFVNDSVVGTANFVLPTSHPAVVPPVVAYSDYEPGTSEALDARREHAVANRMSMSSARTGSNSHTAHEGDEAQLPQSEVNEWAVQAPLFDRGMSKIEGYLLFNVFWYPALPIEFRPPVFSRHDEGDEEEEDEGGPPPTPGIVTFTLHSIDDLNTPEHREVSAAVSLGWHLSPLHTAHMLRSESHRLSRRASNSSDTFSTTRQTMSRGNRLSHGAGEDETQKSSTVATFDSTFEFLCLDPSTTNFVLKVFEGTKGLGGSRRQELVGHTTVPLRDLIGKVAPSENASLATSADGNTLAQGEKVRSDPGRGRDHMLSLLEHPTGKARVCVEWRALMIPEIHRLALPQHG